MPRKVESVDVLRDGHHELMHALNNGSPLECVTISGAFLEQLLGTMLQRFFVQENADETRILTNPMSAVSSFKGRIDLAYCLGLIPDWCYSNLEHIREVRNAFAHSRISADWNTPDVAKHCEAITVFAGYDHVVSKARFHLAVVELFGVLMLNSMSIQSQSPSNWTRQEPVSHPGFEIIE